MNRQFIGKIAVLTSMVGILAFTAWAIWPVTKPVPILPSTKVLDRNGGLLYEVTRPEGGVRTTVPLSAMPETLKRATVAAEDARFYHHNGVDWQAVSRAVWQLMTQRRVVSGASTLEQQTVKNLYFLTDRRTPLQKVREMAAAQYWSLTHTKDQTLETYLNTVSFSNNSFGAAAAARTYFHKPIGELSLAESALLAGMLDSPSETDPFRHWKRAKQRQTYVLDRMVADGVINAESENEAARTDMVVFPPKHPMKAPHFVLRVLDELEAEYPDIRSGGYTIKTTLDPDLQSVAADVVARRLSTLADQRVTNAAVMAMEPRTGQILAYVGSNGYFDEAIQGQVDMVQAQRQPGSSLKPFMYFLAFQRGFSPSTIIADLPVRYETTDGKPYYPRNYSYKYYGPVTIREALGSSLNIPAVKVLDKLGLASFFATLERFGVDFPEQPEHYGLGVVLGGGETTLNDVTTAYARLALAGRSTSPVDVLEVKNANGATVFSAKPKLNAPLFEDQKTAEQAAYLVADVLTDKSARSKSFGEANLLDVSKPVAAKTGTTRDFHDNWAFGYTPDIVLGVWVGNANGEPMQGVSGITGAVPIWHDIIQYRLKNVDRIVWTKPEGLVTRTVCASSGLLANGICPKTKNELFIAGQEPEKQDDWYVRLDIDADTGLAATDKCRAHVIQKTYFVPPPEFSAWLVAAKHETPPAKNCEGGPAKYRSQSAIAGGEMKILSPLDGDVYARDGMVSVEQQTLPFIAGGEPIAVGGRRSEVGYADYIWELNGQTIKTAEPTYLWKLQPGEYTLKLLGADGEVRFTVR